MPGPRPSLVKRKAKAALYGSKSRPRLENDRALRSAARASRVVTRATNRLSLSDDEDEFEEAEDDEYEEEAGGDEEEDDETSEDLAAPLSSTSIPRLPPKVIHSEKLPILLSLVSPHNTRTHTH